VQGHAWTTYVHLRDRLRPPTQEAAPWSATVDDALLGPVRLTGWHKRVSPTDLLILVHGLGGHADSGYVVRMARAAEALGLSTLRLSLRGADRSGEDYYHAGLTDDVRAALDDPELATYQRVTVLGFSMGGHIALRLAAENHPRVSAYAAICAPLDLAASCDFIDRPRSLPYRRHLLSGLKEMYREYARRRPEQSIAESALRRIRRIRDYDEAVIVPRHGFRSADDYYRRASASSVLGAIEAPTLFLATEGDPMITPDTLVRHLARRSRSVDVRWLEHGGHVAFPRRARLEDQVLGWLRQAGSSPAAATDWTGYPR